MKVALVDPRWTFEGSVHFGCREGFSDIQENRPRPLAELERRAS